MKAQWKTIAAYNKGQKWGEKAVCELLRAEIERALPDATSKIWHGAPVWFIDGNPVVGYFKRKSGICLLFWSGQSFATEGLSPEGSFKAAEMVYTSADDVRVTRLRKWLRESKRIQWDYKNIVKHRGLRPLSGGLAA